MRHARAVAGAALAGVLGACADLGPGPSAPEERQLGPLAAPPSGPKCNLGFTLVLDESKPVRSDLPPAPYMDKVDGVMVRTGGEGFRFDTNTSQEKETANDIRRVTLDFSGTGYEALATAPKGIDLRFDQRLTTNLCTFQIGVPQIVPTTLTFLSSETGQIWRLQYGGFPPGGDDDCGARGVSGLTVTRLPPVGTKRVWSMVSGSGPLAACLYIGAVHQAEVPMEIAFTITER